MMCLLVWFVIRNSTPVDLYIATLHNGHLFWSQRTVSTLTDFNSSTTETATKTHPNGTITLRWRTVNQEKIKENWLINDWCITNGADTKPHFFCCKRSQILCVPRIVRLCFYLVSVLLIHFALHSDTKISIFERKMLHLWKKVSYYYLPRTTSSRQRPFSCVPKVAIVERFDCKQLLSLIKKREILEELEVISIVTKRTSHEIRAMWSELCALLCLRHFALTKNSHTLANSLRRWIDDSHTYNIFIISI